MPLRATEPGMRLEKSLSISPVDNPERQDPIKINPPRVKLFTSNQSSQNNYYMNKTVSVGILATLKVKPGKEDDVEEFLKSALPLANQEEATTVWFALRIGPSTFGIFDAFTDETGRAAHLSGPIASALMAKWQELLSEPPIIEKVDVLAAKLLS
jgi:quinol monooxygenase YgiN